MFGFSLGDSSKDIPRIACSAGTDICLLIQSTDTRHVRKQKALEILQYQMTFSNLFSILAHLPVLVGSLMGVYHLGRTRYISQ